MRDVKKSLKVRAHWDADVRRWWAESDEIPGLVTEADTFDDLVREITLVAPELLELNGCADRLGIPIRITGMREVRLAVPS